MTSATRSQPRPQPQAAAPAAPQAQPDQPSPPAAETPAEKRPPVFNWSHPTASGRVEIAAWEKIVSTDNGDRVVYSVTCQRSYRKQEGGYDNTGVFWPSDLLVLAHGLGVVFNRIKAMQQNAAKDVQEDTPF
jgi:hypothetical protein